MFAGIKTLRSMWQSRNGGQMERAVNSLGDEISRLRDEFRSQVASIQSDLRTVATQAATAQTQILSHIAVCEERQRLSMLRQVEHDRWTQSQTRAFEEFMATSSNDRAGIRQAVQQVKEQVTASTIKLLIWVVGLNFAITGALIGAWFKVFGLHT